MENQSETMNPAVKLEDCLKDSRILITSCLGVGFVKYAPGTFGSIFGALFLSIFTFFEFPKLFLAPFFIMLLVISSFLTQRVLDYYKVEDPSWIVIDEFLGIYLGFMIYQGHKISELILLFIFFRFFDILKPWPISAADQIKTGFGVILDDLIAGVFAGLCVIATAKIFAL